MADAGRADVHGTDVAHTDYAPISRNAIIDVARMPEGRAVPDDKARRISSSTG
jgi:hypothetical protein